MCSTYKNHFTKDKLNMNMKFINNLLLKYFKGKHEEIISDELKIEGNKLCLSLTYFNEFSDLKFNFELVKGDFDEKKADKVLINKKIKMLENKIEKLQEFISSCSLDIEIYERFYVKSDTTDLFLSEFSYKHTNNNNQGYFQTCSLRERFSFSSGIKILGGRIFKYHIPQFGGSYDNSSLIRYKISKENKKRKDFALVKWNFEKLNFLNLNFLGVDCLVCDFELQYIPETVKILYLVDYQEVSLSKKDMDSLLNKCCLLEDIILQNATYNSKSFCNLKNCYDAIKENLDINFTFVSMNYLKDGKLENLSNVNFED